MCYTSYCVLHVYGSVNAYMSSRNPLFSFFFYHQGCWQPKRRLCFCLCCPCHQTRSVASLSTVRRLCRLSHMKKIPREQDLRYLRHLICCTVRRVRPQTFCRYHRPPIAVEKKRRVAVSASPAHYSTTLKTSSTSCPPFNLNYGSSQFRSLSLLLSSFPFLAVTSSTQ